MDTIADGQTHTLPSPVSVVNPTKALNAGLILALATTPVKSFVVGRITIFANGVVAATPGLPVSRTSNALMIGTSTLNFLGDPGIAVATAAAIAGHIVQAAQPSPEVVFVDEQSITPGGTPVIVSATAVALHSNGDLILGSSTVSDLFPAVAPLPTWYFIVSGAKLTLSSNCIIVSGTTPAPGAPAIEINSTPVSMALKALVVGTSTITLSTPSSESIVAVTTTQGQTLTSIPNGVAVAGTTLSPVGLVLKYLAHSSLRPLKTSYLGHQQF